MRSDAFAYCDALKGLVPPSTERAQQPRRPSAQE